MNETFMKDRPVLPLVLSMSLPMVLSMLVNSLYNIVDSFFVAQISEDAMTALSLVYPVQNLITAVGVGFGIGINAVIAFHLGAGEKDKADRAASQGMLLSLVHGVGLTLLCILGLPAFLGAFTQSPSVLALGVAYGQVAFAFTLIIVLGLTFEKTFQAVGRMKATTTLEDLKDVDIVFEAMVENMELKKEAFAKMAPVIQPNAIFVSNTSSLSITELAAASQRPEKFLGMHFFSPVPAMKLVEIINAYDTSEDTIETGKAVAKGFGKEFVTVQDVPMFIANRVMCPMMNEAAILAGENVCSYEDIDKACELGYNLPMGPLKLADFIGIDVMIEVMESLYQETADSKYRPAHLYKVLYRAGHLGQKTGKGFYDYSK